MTLRLTTPGPSDDTWLPSFLESLRAQDLANATVSGYGHDIGKFTEWFRTLRPSARLKELAPVDLAQYREYLVAIKHAKPATIKRKLDSLRRFCRWAFKDKRLAHDITEEMRPVRLVRRAGPKGLAEAEVHALLRAAGASRKHLALRNYALAQLLLQAGVRLGEAATLLISDVRISSRSGVVRIRRGKGRKEREVPLNASVRRALQRYLDARKAQPDEPLFTSARGEGMAERSIQHLITTLARRARIERLPVTPHTLRHTFSLTYLKDHPGKLGDLSSLLGHDSLDTTAIYTRPSMDDLARDLEASTLNVFP
jgi:integrase/recombinase XerC